MSSISDIYGEVYDGYISSLRDSRERKGGNHAEQSVIYRYFFSERLKNYGVAESGEEKEGEYVFSGEKKTEEKEKENLLQIYRIWDEKKVVKGKMKINPVMLMLGYNQFLSDGKKIRFLRLLLTYMVERPVRYREGHAYYTGEMDEDKEASAKRMYLSFLAGLYSIAVGRTFSASDHVEMRSVQNALKKLLSEVGEDKETDECIAKKLDQLTSADLRSVTDGLLRTSLHANIKDYLFNMGYPVTGGKEVTFEAVKERRKLDKSVVFLEHCMRRLDYQIVSGAESVKRSGGEGPAYKAACETLLEKMNDLSDSTGFTHAMVPLMTHGDIMLCVIGREYYKYLYEKIFCTPPVDGSFHPKNRNEKKKAYCFAVMELIVDKNDFFCYQPYTESVRFDEAESDFNKRILDRDPLFAGKNMDLLSDKEEGRNMIPEVFWEYFHISGGFGDEQGVQDETEKMLAAAEEEGLRRLKENKKYN